MRRLRRGEDFRLDLQDFLAIVYKRYVDASVTFYLNGVGGMSDADEVLKALKESTYFRALLDDETLTRRVADIAFNSKYHDA